MDRRPVRGPRVVLLRLLTLCVLLPGVGGARAADATFDGTNGAAGFEAALRAAGPGGAVKLTRGFTLDRTVFVPAPDVTIFGRRQTIRGGAPSSCSSSPGRTSRSRAWCSRCGEGASCGNASRRGPDPRHAIATKYPQPRRAASTPSRPGQVAFSRPAAA